MSEQEHSAERQEQAGTQRIPRDPDARERAEAIGLPPEEGPEKRITFVRPSLHKGRPLSTIGLVLLPLIITVALKLLIKDNFPWWPHVLLTFAISGVVFWFTLFVSWLRFSVARSLEITNKRVIERRGLFSRRVNEVLHNHIRNISVNQSFLDRIFNIGQVGISSAGQADIEIHMRDIPDPRKIREIIDAYRPL